MQEKRSPRCVQCNKPIGEDHQFRPFCSERCKLLDLGNWLGERYRIPVTPSNGESEERLATGNLENPEE
jgi:endogenous inhibitor of DNA gyrase (YacG/DUF329 family)